MQMILSFEQECHMIGKIANFFAIIIKIVATLRIVYFRRTIDSHSLINVNLYKYTRA